MKKNVRRKHFTKNSGKMGPMTVSIKAPQEARYRSGGATGGIRGKKAAGDGSRGQSARKRGLGAAARPAEGPHAQPRGRPRRKKRRRERACFVRKRLRAKERAATADAGTAAGRAGAPGAQPRRPPRAKKHRLAKAPVLSKNPDKIQVIIAKNKPYMLHTACFFLIRI